MDLSKRMIIQNQLNQGHTASDIASILKVHKSTISREIKNYRYLCFKGENKPSICSKCERNAFCNLKHRCGSILCSNKCVGCKSLEVCSHFKLIVCNIETRYPFVCNNCRYIHICRRNHYLYDARKANESSIEIRRVTRQGINLSNDEYLSLDKTIKDGVDKGQSIYHIWKSNDVGKCLKTIYNYINSGKLSIKSIDLPRAVTLKKRHSSLLSKYEYNENKNIDRSHRMYADWLIYQARKRIIIYWEMDFLGAPIKSEQEILSLIIPQFEFVYLIAIQNPTKEKVIDVFDDLQEKLGDDFSKLFEAILTDRDSKFNSFQDIECDHNGVIRTRIFFCNPASSTQKPFVENINNQLRSVFKKGVKLSDITQTQCNEISSNLNSRFLNSIDGKRPVDLFVEYFGLEILDKLGLKIIEPNDVKIVSFKKY